MDELARHERESAEWSFVLRPPTEDELCLVSSSVGALRYLPKESVRSSVATGIARGPTTIARAEDHTTPSPSPSHAQNASEQGPVSIRPIKEFVRALRPDHPLRTVLVGEPDQLSREEFYVKITIWLRLLPSE